MSALGTGELVRKINMPARVGRILEIVHDEQLNEHLARVQFGDGVETCLLSNLEMFEEGTQDMWQDMIKLRVSGATPFRTLLTFIRIKTPPSPIISSFGTARVRFYPYQFKPLLKILENPNQRLLIADDVGLGKTIEAGYALREWRARHGLQNVLIVVPARLTSKWKNELEQRFEERFNIVGSREIKNTLSKVTKGYDLPEFNWIASYETLRTSQITRLLTDVPLSLDLLIMDEAHRVRNRKTNQYKCAAVLKDYADAMIYLTATPVQTGIDNLYTLASLLMPDMFESRGAFDDILEANRPIIRACQLITQRKLKEAADNLESLETHRLTKSLSEDPYFKDVLKRLRVADPSDRAAIVRLQRDACEFSLLGHLLSRTRKAEVMENWPVREAQNPYIELTAAERDIYNSVRHIVRILRPQTSGWGATMAAITAYRYTASCIPAAVEYFRERFVSGELLPSTQELSKEEEREFMEALRRQDEDWAAGIDITKEVATAIQQILNRCPAPGTDSKYRALLSVVDGIWNFDRQAAISPRKIVIFSYFKRTLEYLRRQLMSCGIETRVIHGDVPMPDRLSYIEEFLTSSDINVLLSSEVGGEGIDLQRASIVVNYDLPWNPMVVEQRIGRIDRIGQEADKLVIINLVAEGTIEQRILLRLYERIGLFHESIGELDDIIGPMDLQNLMVEALRGELSEDQIQKRVDSTASAAEEKLSQAKTLSREVDGLLAADQAFLDEIQALIRTRRVPTPADLKDLLLNLLQEKFSGIHYESDRSKKAGSLMLGRDAAAELGNWARTYSADAHRVAQRFLQGSVPVTFSADVAMEQPRAEFIQARHPLIQFAISILEKHASQQPRSFALQVDSDTHARGLWVIGIWSLMLGLSRPEARLEVVACNLLNKEIKTGEAADELLIACLSEASDLDMSMLDVKHADIEQCIDTISAAYKERRAALLNDIKDIEERKLTRIRTTWLQSLTLRKEAAERRLTSLKQREAKEFALKMAQATLYKREKALKDRQSELKSIQQMEWEEREVASILLSVRCTC